MEFKVNQQTNPNDHREFIAVPSVEGGAFVIDHGEYYGRRVYSDMKLTVPDEEREQALAGDFSGSLARLKHTPERPGVIDVVPWMLDVSVTIPGSGNTVHHNVDEVLELAPHVPEII